MQMIAVVSQVEAAEETLRGEDVLPQDQIVVSGRIEEILIT